jgi:hypothetical protein
MKMTKKYRGKKQVLYEIWLVEKNDPNWNKEEACHRIGLNIRTGKRYFKEFETGVKYKKQRTTGAGGENIHKEFGTEKGCIHLNSYTICNKEDALRVANIDLDEWEITKYTVNSWQVTMKVNEIVGTDNDGQPIYEDVPTTKTNYQHKFDLKPKVPNPTEIAIRNLITEIPQIKIKTAPKFKAKSGRAAEIALVDPHIAKMAWAAETGRRDYDLKKSVSDYEHAVGENLSWIEPFKPEIIYYVMGHDYLHVENYEGTTPKGHNVLDVDSRLPKIISEAIKCQLKCIGMCRKVARVNVIPVPGNHDIHANIWLSHVIDQAFKNDKYVTVDLTPSPRKRRVWGKLLVGFAHDIHNKFPSWNNELAHAFPRAWGRTDFREWHCGHKHKKQVTKMHPVLTQGGVLIRQLTALSPIDKWHFDGLYTDAVPGGESFIWDKEHGVIANFTAWSPNPIKKGN